jgi:hypothetical protein
MRYLRVTAVLVGLFVLLVVAAGCSSGGRVVEAGGEMAPMSRMPREVQQAPATVRESYQFAVANPDVLERIPCYCGCGAMGHTSSYSCYAQGTETAGTLSFDGHALGCSICVDITQDTMRLLRQGKDISEIKAYVDQRYSPFGPPTP